LADVLLAKYILEDLQSSKPPASGTAVLLGEAMMAGTTRDPWVDVRTLHGFAADQVISALQKEIRRGHTENAVLLAYEMARTSPALEDYLWQRLLIIAVEDIGFGEPMAPLLVHTLFQTVQTFDRSLGERALFAVHAVRYLCGCPKDRSSDALPCTVVIARRSSTRAPSRIAITSSWPGSQSMIDIGFIVFFLRVNRLRAQQ
jgi:hypothetical protein